MIHPYASLRYAESFLEPEVKVLEVPPWRSHVLVRRPGGRKGVRSATGVYPFASLDPDCDLEGGLAFLKENRIGTVNLLSDALWSPPVERLKAAFGFCRQLKHTYLLDREGEDTSFRKRHRNRMNNAVRLCEMRVVGLAEHMDEWWQIYDGLAERKRVGDSARLSRENFERIVDLPGLVTFAARAQGELVALSMWLRFRDIVYNHFTASTERGYEVFANYACYARAFDYFHDCRLLCFGPNVGVADSRDDGLAEFKRGFANATWPNYLCSATLFRPELEALDSERAQ